MLDQIAHLMRPYVPFTALNVVWRHLEKGASSLLDVGCGPGRTGAFLQWAGGIRTYVGVDLFLPYLRQARATHSARSYIRADIRFLPFREKIFDIVIAMEVFEHLEREEGLKLLQVMERIARRQVIITTPIGAYIQHEYDENPLQKHRSAWYPKEIERFGYQVVACGLQGLGGETGLATHLPKVFHPMVWGAWVMAGPFVRWFPRLGGDMVCIRRLVVQKLSKGNMSG